MKIIVWLIPFLFISFCLYGQSEIIVTGHVRDSSGQGIMGANVWLMMEKDTLKGMSGEGGAFRIGGVKSPVFILRVTSLGFDAWERSSTINGNMDFQVVLKAGMKTLREFVVKGQVPPVVYKKDTVEYDASQFAFTEHDMISDLMRRLPGLEVNSDGSISMMGQKVTKIMINGQEFMVSDIKTLMSLIPVSLISKIQLIDDYDDINKMRGTTRGETQKIINLKTNAGIGSVLSSRLSSTYGEGGLYKLEGNLLKFNSQHQYLLAISNSNIGQYTGKGNNTSVEMSMRRKLKGNLTINLGVDYRKEGTDVISTSEQEIATSEGSLYNSIYSKGKNHSDNGSFKSELKLKPNDRNSFLMHFDANCSDIQAYSNIENIQTGFQRKNQISINNNQNSSDVLIGDLIYNHFFKEGSVLTVLAKSQWNRLNNQQNSRNIIRYYEIDTLLFKDSTIHQNFKKQNYSYDNQAEILYTHPFSEKKSLEFTFSYLKSLSLNGLTTSIEKPAGMFVVVDSLSNRFHYNIRELKIATSWQYKSRNLNYCFGINLVPYKLFGLDRKSEISFFPILQLDYKVSKNSSLKFYYKGNNVIPTYNQVSIVPDYSDIQNIVIGNPNLKAGKQHVFNMEYRSGLGKHSLFTNLSFGTVRHNIISSISLIEDVKGTFKQEIRFLNANSNFSIESNSGWSGQIGKNNNISFFEKISYSKSPQYYNLNNWNVSSLSSSSKFVLNANYGFLAVNSDITYVYSRNLLSEKNNVEIHTINYSAYNIIKFTSCVLLEVVYSGQNNFCLSKKFESSSFLLNSRLYCWWFKRKIITSFYLENVMNNKGMNFQNVNSTTISMQNFNNRGRYFVINLIYNFRKVK